MHIFQSQNELKNHRIVRFLKIAKISEWFLKKIRSELAWEAYRITQKHRLWRDSGYSFRKNMPSFADPTYISWSYCRLNNVWARKQGPKLKWFLHLATWGSRSEQIEGGGCMQTDLGIHGYSSVAESALKTESNHKRESMAKLRSVLRIIH